MNEDQKHIWKQKISRSERDYHDAIQSNKKSEIEISALKEKLQKNKLKRKILKSEIEKLKSELSSVSLISNI